VRGHESVIQKWLRACSGPSEIFTINKLVIMFKKTENKFRSDELAKALEISIYARRFHQSCIQR
jgi:response regulator of citrate/malate metabolism